MLIEDKLRELIQVQAPSMDLRSQALSVGMTTLREAGIEAIENGQATVEEVLNYTW